MHIIIKEVSGGVEIFLRCFALITDTVMRLHDLIRQKRLVFYNSPWKQIYDSLKFTNTFLQWNWEIHKSTRGRTPFWKPQCCARARKICLTRFKPYLIFYMIYPLTAIGLPPGGSSTVHICSKTIHRTTQWNTIPSMEHTQK